MTETIRHRSFAWNAAALSTAQLCSPILNAALILLMARWAGPETLGAYTLLVTAFMVLDQLRLFGLQRLVTRDLAGGRATGLQQYRGLVGVSDAGGIVALILLVSYGLWVGISPAAVAMFAAALLPSGRAWANDALFLALGRADFTTRVVVAECILRVSLSVAVFVLRGADLAALGAAYATGRLLAAALGARYRRQLLGGVETSRDWNAARALVGHIPAFFAVTALPLLLLRADYLVVGATAGAYDVGLYGGAARLVAILLLVPDGIMLANFARLSRSGDGVSSRRAVAAVAMAVLFVLTPLAAVVTVFSAEVATLIYGGAFAGSGRYLAWLAWSVPLFIMCRALGDTLIATGHQRRLALAILGTVGASVPVYMLLAAAFSSTGVAIAYLASLVILLLGSAAAARPMLWQPFSPPDAAAVGAEATMAVR